MRDMSEAIAKAALGCEIDARAHGWTGDSDYELTRDDCDWIVAELRKAFGRMPTAAEWHDAGYAYVGNRHYAPAPRD